MVLKLDFQTLLSVISWLKFTFLIAYDLLHYSAKFEFYALVLRS